ncbi:type II secretion system F family protein [Candidatus Peregrinibacteria bacterium]|nr:MAG: type II secretion system F family protein [Candidatus Peregrinibacteria bacterium]
MHIESITSPAKKTFWQKASGYWHKGVKEGEKPVIPAVENARIERNKTAFGNEKLPWTLRWMHFSAKERLFFYDQLATLIDSGITLIDALSLMQAQAKQKRVKAFYQDVIHQLNGGMSLAETMQRVPNIFPPMQSALIEAAEKSGNLKNVLNKMVVELETKLEYVRKIKGAMFYPVLLIFLAISMAAGMMIFVIPKVAELYEQSNTNLPRLTQAVIDISHFLTQYYATLLFSLVAGITAMVLTVKKTRMGKRIWEQSVGIIPIFGKLSHQKMIMEIAGNLAMLLESGVLISDAFEITEKTIDHTYYQAELDRIRHGVIMGKSVSEMMGLEDLKTQKFTENQWFPLQMAQMIHIGEVTGTLSKMLYKVRNNYHKNIDYLLKNLSNLIEPIMIFLVAGLVGSILLAVMLPFFYIGTTIS